MTLINFLREELVDTLHLTIDSLDQLIGFFGVVVLSPLALLVDLILDLIHDAVVVDFEELQEIVGESVQEHLGESLAVQGESLDQFQEDLVTLVGLAVVRGRGDVGRRNAGFSDGYQPIQLRLGYLLFCGLWGLGVWDGNIVRIFCHGDLIWFFSLG